MRNHDVALCFVRARARLARFLHDIAHKLGEPSAYYDGVPAGRLVDAVVNELEAKGVPRFDPRDPTWPLKPHARIRRFLINPGGWTTPEVRQPPKWWAEVIEGRPAPSPGPE